MTQLLGVGMLFIPVEETRAEEVLERCLLSHDFEMLCWRDVPVRTEWLGEMALSTMPKIRQVLVVDAARMRSRGRWSGGCILRGSSLSGRMSRAM